MAPGMDPSTMYRWLAAVKRFCAKLNRDVSHTWCGYKEKKNNKKIFGVWRKRRK